MTSVVAILNMPFDVPPSAPIIAAATLVGATVAFLFARVGLVSMFTCCYMALMGRMIVSTDLSAWYAPQQLLVFAMIVAVTAWVAWVAVWGRK